jgi:hypothetical protein
MNRCPQCGLALVDVTGMGPPVYEQHFACGCDGRLWALDKRTDSLTIRDEGTPPA